MNSTKRNNWKWPQITHNSTTKKQYRISQIPTISSYKSTKESASNLGPQINIGNMLCSKTFSMDHTDKLPENEQKCLERKTSSFLLNCGQKLKRQYRRQHKNKKKQQISHRTVSLIKQPFFPFSNSRTRLQTQKCSQILVLKKKFLINPETQQKDKQSDKFSDSKLKSLLDQISQIKKKDQRQVQHIKRQSFYALQNRKDSGRLRNLQSGLRLTFNNSILNQISAGKLKYEYHTLKKPNSKTKPTLDKYYNFKHLDPWESKQNGFNADFTKLSH